MIRFKRNDGTSFPDWEEKKVKDIFEFTNGKGHEQNVVEDGEYIIVNSKFISTEGKIKKYSDEQILPLYKNDITMVMSDLPNGRALAKCFLVDSDNKYTLNQRICCLRGEEDAIFMANQLNRNAYYLRFDDGYQQTNLKKDDVLNCPVYVPHKEEQKKIANFLSDIDVIIMASEQEIAKLEEQKRGAMQKIFSQEVQFKSDEGLNFPEWNTVKFGDIIKEFSVKTVKEDETTLLSCAINGIFLNSELFDHQRGSSNIGYRKIKRGTLILSAQNLHLGNANVNTKFDEGMVSPAYKTFNIIGCEIEFMKQWIKREETKQFFYNATTVGASVCRRNVDWGALYKQTLKLPCKEEQQTIASFLSEFDTAIELAKQELEYWKELKQGLLQQMFM